MPMEPVRFNIRLFREPEDRWRSQRAILWLMEALVQINLGWLKEHPETPALYEAPVKYLFEEGKPDDWMDIPTIQEVGSGDCEDLACWRAAELKNIGVNVRPYIKWRKRGNGYIYHAVVEWPDGKLEDPSLAMGMSGPMYRKPMFI